MQLTERDIAIVDAVYRHRVLAADQIEALFFSSSSPRGRRSSCQNRLKLLFHHGFLQRIVPALVLGEGRKPYVYALDERGADIVASIQGVDRENLAWQPKQNEVGGLFLNHLLAVSLVRVVFEVLAADQVLTILGWHGEHELRGEPLNQRMPYVMQGRKKVRTIPDGYFVLQPPGKAETLHFFLEVDLGTESNKQWQDKINAYNLYRETGESVQHFGTQNYRILTVTTSDKRLQNLQQATREAEGKHHYWFTTLDQFDLWNPGRALQAIWRIPSVSERKALY
ncbi:MAG: replication-relaxation family protein [Caldilineales bacterium]|nr:replication-relaxation family protein [Caldilineales bacterium]